VSTPKVCGATTKSGKPCQARPMANGRCRIHGGATPSGIASPHYVHGRYSQKMPKRLTERFEASMSDPDLLNLTPEIALMDARLEDVLGRVDSGESGHRWKELHGAWKDYATARARGDVQAMHDALVDVERIITAGVADTYAWDEVRALWMDRTKLVSSERKRRIEMQSMLTVEQAMIMLNAFIDTVKLHVTDRTTLSRIAADFERAGVRLGLALRS